MAHLTFPAAGAAPADYPAPARTTAQSR